MRDNTVLRHLPALLGAILVSGAAQAQEPADPTVFRAQVELVTVLCTVQDRAGRYLDDLNDTDFRILEDGLPQEILHFSHASRADSPPLSVALLIDASQSVKQKLDFEQQAAVEFLQAVVQPGRDATVLVEFGDQVKWVAGFTDELESLGKAIRDIYPQGRTRLYDAAWLATQDLLAARSGRRVMVILSDGKDTSSLLTEDEALRVLQQREVTVFAIGVEADGQATNFDGLQLLTEMTGGFFTDSQADLDRLRLEFSKIQRAVNSQYVLAYRPRASLKDGLYRSIRVELRGRGLKVSHRKGYFRD